MTYTFKSKATGNLIMLQRTGDRVLAIIGKEPSAQGILLPAQMPAAIRALEQAVAREDAQRSGQAVDAADGDGDTGGDPVSLRQRAAPFLDMMRRALQAEREIVWGV